VWLSLLGNEMGNDGSGSGSGSTPLLLSLIPPLALSPPLLSSRNSIQEPLRKCYLEQ